jgi:hypothetical protein
MPDFGAENGKYFDFSIFVANTFCDNGARIGAEEILRAA